MDAILVEMQKNTRNYGKHWQFFSPLLTIISRVLFACCLCFSLSAICNIHFWANVDNEYTTMQTGDQTYSATLNVLRGALVMLRSI